MSRKVYNKLIRDKIPDIIRENGDEPVVYIMPEWQFIQKLEEKLSEELVEYQESKEIEELADLVEVVHALVEAKGYTWEQFEEIRWDKIIKRGAFEKRLCLKYVKTTDHIIINMKSGEKLEYDAVYHSREGGIFFIKLEDGSVKHIDMDLIFDYEISYSSKKGFFNTDAFDDPELRAIKGNNNVG